MKLFIKAVVAISAIHLPTLAAGLRTVTTSHADTEEPGLPPSTRRVEAVGGPPSAYVLEDFNNDGERSLSAPDIKCFGFPVGGTFPPKRPGFGWPPSGYANDISSAACSDDDGEYDGYDCRMPANAGKKCDVWCREDSGGSVGPWKKLRIETSIVPGDFVAESCDEIVCDDPQQFCSGSWSGQDNCGSSTPKSITATCEGHKTDTLSWTLSAEVESTFSANIPFCVKGEVKVTIGGSLTGTKEWQNTFQCNPGMQIPGCEKCSSSGGGCTFSCRVVEVEKVMNADLHLRVKTYYGPHLIDEHVCDESRGNVEIITNEWAQPNGCISINDSTLECSDDEKYGTCAAPTAKPTTPPTTKNPTSSRPPISEHPISGRPVSEKPAGEYENRDAEVIFHLRKRK